MRKSIVPDTPCFGPTSLVIPLGILRRLIHSDGEVELDVTQRMRRGMLRVAVFAALAVCGVQAGYLKDFKNEGATKNKIVKVFQFPRVNLVSAHDPRAYSNTGTQEVSLRAEDSVFSVRNEKRLFIRYHFFRSELAV